MSRPRFHLFFSFSIRDGVLILHSANWLGLLFNRFPVIIIALIHPEKVFSEMEARKTLLSSRFSTRQECNPFIMLEKRFFALLDLV